MSLNNISVMHKLFTNIDGTCRSSLPFRGHQNLSRWNLVFDASSKILFKVDRAWKKFSSIIVKLTIVVKHMHIIWCILYVYIVCNKNWTELNSKLVFVFKNYVLHTLFFRLDCRKNFTDVLIVTKSTSSEKTQRREYLVY